MSLTRAKTAHPADGSGRWSVDGDAGIVQYDLLGNHLTLMPTGGELDAMGDRWADQVRDVAETGDDEAVFELLTGHYRTVLVKAADARPVNPVRLIPFEQIERQFTLAAYGPGRPAVSESRSGGYWIRVVMSDRVGGNSSTFGYFRLDADGTVTEAPRGYARDYRPGRITGLADAVAKYAG
jgi:hypothetical protein